jgi:Arm DNA-binding domain
VGNIMQKALTDRFVASVKPAANVVQQDIFDLGYSGLALRVGRRDKVWCYFHRAGGKLHRMRLGRYPEMSLAEARQAWLQARKGLAEGRANVRGGQSEKLELSDGNAGAITRSRPGDLHEVTSEMIEAGVDALMYRR